MRGTFIELVIRDLEVDGAKVPHYVEVESTREGDPGRLVLVEQHETGNVYLLGDRVTAVREMNRKNRERREAEKESAP